MIWPLLVLLLIGFVKFGIGLMRDKPVFFLFLLMFVTIIVIAIVSSGLGRLTKSGETLLKKLREDFTRERPTGVLDQRMFSLGTALLGATFLAGNANLPFLDSAMSTELQQLGNANRADASSGGCSSGCGGSSCGSDGGGGGSGGCGGD